MLPPEEINECAQCKGLELNYYCDKTTLTQYDNKVPGLSPLTAPPPPPLPSPCIATSLPHTLHRGSRPALPPPGAQCMVKCAGVKKVTAGKCREPVTVCPRVKCTMHCEYGFKENDDGCPMCECKEVKEEDRCDAKYMAKGIHEVEMAARTMLKTIEDLKRQIGGRRSAERRARVRGVSATPLSPSPRFFLFRGSLAGRAHSSLAGRSGGAFLKIQFMYDVDSPSRSLANA